MKILSYAWLVVLLAVFGCSNEKGESPDTGFDSGGETDAGEDPDAGALPDEDTPVDAGTDAGSDPGPEDAGTDAGSDPGPADAGTDAGSDPGPEDAGTEDAGADEGSGDMDHEQLMGNAHVECPASANNICILYVEGSHYQMGYQHGHLMQEGITEFHESLENEFPWSMVMRWALERSPDGYEETYAALSIDKSLDFMREECRGMADAANGAITYEECCVLNSVLWMFEDMFTTHLPIARSFYGCSQFAAANAGTADGKLVHGRNMDWLPIGGIMDNPLVIVRKPTGKLKNVTMAWPGLTANFTGMNEDGLAVAINDHLCLPDPEVYDMEGVPHLQLLSKILYEASDLNQALEIIEAHQASGCSHFFISHGPTRNAFVVEISPNHTQVRWMENDVVFATNHFVEDGVMDDQDFGDVEDMERNSVTRYTRLMERLTGQSKPPHPGLSPDAPDYAFGRVDVPMAIDILRDPVDLRPDKDRDCFTCRYGFTTFTNGSYAVGNNNAVTSYVFVPEDLRFWMAAGWDEECENPAYSPYVGFDLNDLFNGAFVPGGVPTHDPDYNCPYD